MGKKVISYFFWDPKREAFTLPLIDHPIVWYGVFFAFGFWVGYRIFLQLLKGQVDREVAKKLADRFTLYVVVATIIGARLGHYLFYENPFDYLIHPLILLETWKGGLASHGGAFAIFLAIYFFSKWAKRYAPITFFGYLDLIAIPCAFAATCIRVGNFFNQEILGKPFDGPWAVLFAHPMDGSIPLPRHPVQLYEAIAYFAIFLFLLVLPKKKEGKRIGIFLTLVFVARFLLEFFKEEESLIFHAPITMGQLLSLPWIVLGFYFVFSPLASPSQIPEHTGK